MTEIDLIVTDLDDTLWNWCTSWGAGYREYNRHLAKYGVSPEQAEQVWAHMYDRIGGVTIEFPPDPSDILAETSLNTTEAKEVFAQALPASRAARDAALILFPEVRETLDALKDMGIPLVAHTDSPITAAEYRLTQMGLDGAVGELYAKPLFDDFGGCLGLTGTTVSHVSNWVRKPDPAVLNEILRHYDARPERTLYIGDSMRRDMAMANAAGCQPVHASYGLFYEGRDAIVETLIRIENRHPYSKESSLVNDTPAANGYIHIESFGELPELIEELPEVMEW